MEFGLGVLVEACVMWGAHWHHLANTMCGAMWPVVKLLGLLVTFGTEAMEVTLLQRTLASSA